MSGRNKDFIFEAIKDSVSDEVLDHLRASQTMISDGGLNKVYVFDHHVVKFGPNCLYEVGGIQYARTNLADIEVPKVVAYSSNFLIMERLPAQPLCELWHSYTDDDKHYIIKQIVDIIGTLTSIRSDHIGRINPDGTIANPVTLTDRLSKIIRQAVKRDSSLKHLQPSVTMPIVFSHGDFNDGNFLMQGNKIHSLIDWEFAMNRPLVGSYEYPYFLNSCNEERDRLYEVFKAHLYNKNPELSTHLEPVDKLTSLISLCAQDNIDWRDWLIKTKNF